jgi:hypothetical protein
VEAYEKPTADHIKKFKDLKDEFLAAHPNHPTEFPKNAVCSRNLSDRGSETSYKPGESITRLMGTLRILCEPCNRKLDNYGNWWV